MAFITSVNYAISPIINTNVTRLLWSSVRNTFILCCHIPLGCFKPILSSLSRASVLRSMTLSLGIVGARLWEDEIRSLLQLPGIVYHGSVCTASITLCTVLSTFDSRWTITNFLRHFLAPVSFCTPHGIRRPVASR